MGLIGRVLSFVRRDDAGIKTSVVKAEIEGGNIRTFHHVAPPGDDSFPLNSDSVFVGSTQRSGGLAAIGYFDTVNTPKAQAGEKRIYARNPANGMAIAEVWIKSDGSVVLSNAAGSMELRGNGSIAGSNGGGMFELQSGGDFVVNGAKITAAGDVVSAAGKSLDLHVHAINGGSSAPGPTGPSV